MTATLYTIFKSQIANLINGTTLTFASWLKITSLTLALYRIREDDRGEQAVEPHINVYVS